jgi:hypothetical protein
MSFARPLYLKNNGGCSVGPTGSGGPTGSIGPQGSAGGLDFYFNYTNTSGIGGYQSLSPLIDIDPSSVSFALNSGDSSTPINFLTIPINNISEINNGIVSNYIYCSAQQAGNVRVTGFVTNDNGSTNTTIFDVSANITPGVGILLTEAQTVISGGPYPVSKNVTRFGCDLQLVNTSGSTNQMSIVFQTQNQLSLYFFQCFECIYKLS